MATNDLRVVVRLVDQLTRPIRGMTKTVDQLTASVNRLNGANTSKLKSSLSGITAQAGKTRAALASVSPKGGITIATGSATRSMNSIIAKAKQTHAALSSVSPKGGVQVNTTSAINSLNRLQRIWLGLRTSMLRPITPNIRTPRTPNVRGGTPMGGGNYGGGYVGGGAITAYAAARGTGYVAQQGGDLNRSGLNLQLAGLPNDEQQAIKDASWELTRQYKNFSASTIQDAILNVVSVYGDTQQAIAGIDVALKAATVLRTQLPDTEGKDGIVNQVFSLFKSADLRNVTDSPAETEAFINNMTKVITASGGKITPSDFLQLTKYGKTGTQYWNDEFITRIAASMMQEGSPSTVGTALQGMYQTIIAGRITTKGAGLMNDLGLVNEADIIRNQSGDVKGIKAGGVKGSDQFKTNPYDWVQTVFNPAMEKYLLAQGKLKPGFSPDDYSEAAADITAGIFARNPDWMINTLMKERPIERDRQLIDRATGIEGAGIVQQKDFYTAVSAFTTQWNNLLGALTSPLMQPATDALNYVASAMGGLAQMAIDHPDIAGTIGMMAAAGAGLVALAAGVQAISGALAIAGFMTGGGGAAGAGLLGLGGGIGRAGGWLGRGLGFLGGAAGVVGVAQIAESLGLAPQPPGIDKPWHQSVVEALDPGLSRRIYGSNQSPSTPAPDSISAMISGWNSPVAPIVRDPRDVMMSWPGMPYGPRLEGGGDYRDRGSETGQAMGQGTVEGLQGQSGALNWAAAGMLAQVQAILGVGVTLPVRLGAVSGVDAGVVQNASTRVSAGGGTTNNVGGIVVNAAPGQSEAAIAENVHARFNAATNRQLSDGAFA